MQLTPVYKECQWRRELQISPFREHCPLELWYPFDPEHDLTFQYPCPSPPVYFNWKGSVIKALDIKLHPCVQLTSTIPADKSHMHFVNVTYTCFASKASTNHTTIRGDFFALGPTYNFKVQRRVANFSTAEYCES